VSVAEHYCIIFSEFFGIYMLPEDILLGLRRKHCCGRPLCQTVSELELEDYGDYALRRLTTVREYEIKNTSIASAQSLTSTLKTVRSLSLIKSSRHIKAYFSGELPKDTIFDRVEEAETLVTDPVLESQLNTI
jgi:hypothetical protein